MVGVAVEDGLGEPQHLRGGVGLAFGFGVDGFRFVLADYALREQLVSRPTEAFDGAGIDPEAERVTLGWLRGRETQHLGDPPAQAGMRSGASFAKAPETACRMR